MSTNVPQIMWGPTGITVPTASAVLAGVQADINAAFGGNLNFTNGQTPQNQLATSFAAVVSNCYAAIAYFVNNIDPDVSSGFMQDAIGRIYFLTRNAGVATAVSCTCTGLAGTVIPQGSLAQDTSGNVYASTAAATIGSGGTATIEFQNQVIGPIACPSGTLTQIYQAVSGWDSITNPADGVIGSDIETQAAFALRRAQSVASNAQGSLQSIYASVFAVSGVIDVYAYENDTDATVDVGSTNYPVVAHSIYVAVVGGSSTSIAQAIYNKKSPGCAMNGNTTVQVQDTSGYENPIPTYSITYNVPTTTNVYFAVTIKNSTALPANIVALVQNAIIAQFTGENGVPRARIGATLYASQYYAPIIAISPSVIQLVSVLVGLTASPSSTSLDIGIDQTPNTSASYISVTLS